jgi:FkbM family methyltransferase
MIRKIFFKIVRLTKKQSINESTSDNSEALALWTIDQGDKTLRLNYDIHENSIVFDLGGYQGQWASDIFAMYCCSIHVFEPVEQFAEEIKQRFINNKKIKVHSFGLASEQGKIEITLDENSSSSFRLGDKSTQGNLKNFSNFLDENSISKVDLIKINIEGGEYDLLEHLLENGIITVFRNIQVQFHNFVPNCEQRMQNICNQLRETHFPTYQYRYVWENWQIKDDFTKM